MEENEAKAQEMPWSAPYTGAGQEASQGANRFDMWTVALQKRDARSSPCSELAPNGKVALMSFFAATSGQIVVPAFRLLVYALRGSAESYKKCPGTRITLYQSRICHA